MASIARFPDRTMNEVDREDALDASRGIVFALPAAILFWAAIVLWLVVWLS